MPVTTLQFGSRLILDRHSASRSGTKRPVWQFRHGGGEMLALPAGDFR